MGNTKIPKNILTIGFNIPSDNLEFIDFSSNTSLLDYDIIIFDPSLSSSYEYYEEYQGKDCLSDSASFQIKGNLEHWRREITEALKCGKTIILMCNQFEEVYVATGQFSYSGTGKNRSKTRHVSLINNYGFLPGAIKVTDSMGKKMKLIGKNNLLASYFSELKEDSFFNIIISKGKNITPLIVTNSGEKILGAKVHFDNTSGSLLLLPYIDFDKEEFTDYDEDDDEIWTKPALKLGGKFISQVIKVDKSLRLESKITPPPSWLESERFDLPKEIKIRQNLLKLETKIEELRKKIVSQDELLGKTTFLKSLLYESGKTLESAVCEALKILGFNTTSYHDSDSEFDIVFESKEGRLLGEVEGKDNKPINIEKLRQLEMNIHEDFERPEINDIAKGVLFGNANRLVQPELRDDYFTTKCITAAKRNQTALVKTSDLFDIIQFLLKNKNIDFAKKCRLALIESNGVVSFPAIPSDSKTK